MSKRFLLYRYCSKFISRWVRRPIVSDLGLLQKTRTPAIGKLWFHAASVGELEGLMPLIEAAGARDAIATVSVWSHSGDSALVALGKACSFSVMRAPHEGLWLDYFEKYKPSALILYRYEAWPDLWGSAFELKIPVILIGGRLRSSLIWLKRILKLLGLDIPAQAGAVHCFDSQQVPALREFFPEWKVDQVANPRWQRAFDRSVKKKTTRGQEVLRQVQALPKPVLFLSQIWPKDLELLTRSGVLNEWQGGVVAIPHLIDPAMLYKIERGFRKAGFALSWTQPNFQTQLCGGDKTVLVVNETGILAEIYAAADRVYVGGGFGKGVHSLIEPGVLGLPVASGPKGTDRFEEVDELRSQGLYFLISQSNVSLGWRQFINASAKPPKIAEGVFHSPAESQKFWWDFLQVQATLDQFRERE